MSGAALVTENAVVYKPAEESLWTGLKLSEIYRDAGLPTGVFDFLSGSGREAGEALWRRPGVDGVVFTGSKAVGLRIYRGLSTGWIKPCLLEMGGKNAAIVMESADLDAAADGVTRSAFGLQNQKCSATSRVYVHERVARPFLEKLVERATALRIGDPTERDVFFGPVINARAVATFERAVAQARREGAILHGGQRLTDGSLERGYFLAPTIGRVRPLLRRAIPAGAKPHGDRGMRDYPRIVVAPPGPKAREIVARQDRWASTSYPKEYPLVIARGERAIVEDVDGNRYLDFMAGIAGASTGYGHPKDVQAIQQAAARFLPICGRDFYYESFSAICERLTLPPSRRRHKGV